MNKKSKFSRAAILYGLITGIAAVIPLHLFLSGKIIDIPRGTSKGAMIRVVGYMVIVLAVSGLSFAILFFLKKRHSK
jgi:hypothetical protein